MTKKEVIVFETINWKVILMNQQLYLGRCVVVLKRPCGHLSEITQDEILDFFEVVKKMERLFKKTFGAVMFNWTCLMNNAYQVTPAVPQVHWHFRPRYDKSVDVDGNIFIDPNFGHHYLHGDDDKKMISQDLLELINKKLQENLK